MSNVIKIIKSLSDETRLAMVKKLSEGGEFSCQEMSQLFHLSQPTISHHFNKLVDAGIVNERKDSIWRFYTLNKKFLRENGINIEKMTDR